MENLHPAAQVTSVAITGLITIVFIIAVFTNFFDKK